MITCDRYQDLLERAALFSEAVVRTYVRCAAAGSARYGKALLKYGAAVGRLVQEASFIGGAAWSRAAKACRIAHLGLAALYLQSSSDAQTCDVRLIQEAARLAHYLGELADTFGRLPVARAGGAGPASPHRPSPRLAVDGDFNGHGAVRETAAHRANAAAAPNERRRSGIAGSGRSDPDVQ